MKTIISTFCGHKPIFWRPQSSNFVTPLVPPIQSAQVAERKRIIYYFFLVAFFYSFNCKASDSSFVSSLVINDSIYTDIVEYYENKTTVEIGDYTYKEKYKWVKFLPSFGYFVLQNQPWLGWNSTQLFDVLNYKRRKKALILKIIKTNQIACATDFMKLERLVSKFKRMKNIYDNLLIRLDLEKAILDIKEEQYKTHDITNEEYFRANISYNEVELRVGNMELLILETYNSIQELAHRKENVNLFNTFEYVEND